MDIDKRILTFIIKQLKIFGKGIAYLFIIVGILLLIGTLIAGVIILVSTYTVPTLVVLFIVMTYVLGTKYE